MGGKFKGRPLADIINHIAIIGEPLVRPTNFASIIMKPFREFVLRSHSTLTAYNKLRYNKYSYTNFRTGYLNCRSK